MQQALQLSERRIDLLQMELDSRIGEASMPSSPEKIPLNSAHFVQSTPVRQIIGRDAAPFTISKGTPARYAQRLQKLQDMIREIQETQDPALVIELLQALSMFIEDFQSLHIDIVKLRNHLEVMKERELDLANSELEALRNQCDLVINDKNQTVEELRAQIDSYKSNLTQLRLNIETMKDRELDLATTELSDLQQQWEEFYQAQQQHIGLLANQSAALSDLSQALKQKEIQNEKSTARISELEDMVCVDDSD